MTDVLKAFRIGIQFALEEAMRTGGWIETLADHPRVQSIINHFMESENEVEDSEILENIIQEEIDKLRRPNYEL